MRYSAMIVMALILTACASTPRGPARTQEKSARKVEAIRPAFATPDPEELVILVFGDSGTGSSVQYEVGASMFNVCSAEKCQFALGLGDNIYEHGVASADDPQFETKFERAYEVFGRFDFWMVAGNHDHETASALPEVEYTKRSARWRMPALHYEVPGLPDWAHIYGLDTDVLDEAQVSAAEKAVCGKSGWKLLFGHHPLFSNGEHGDDPMRQKQLSGMLLRCGVQAYLAGHDHHQEHISAPGIEYFINGSAAKYRTVKQGVKYPEGSGFAQNFASSEYGFAILRLTREKMAIRFYDRKGGELYRWPVTK